MVGALRLVRPIDDRPGRQTPQTEKYIMTPEGIQRVELTPEEIEEQAADIRSEEQKANEQATAAIFDNIWKVLF